MEIPSILPERWVQFEPFFDTDYDMLSEDWWHATEHPDAEKGYTLDVGCGEDMRYHCQLVKDCDWQNPISYYAFYQVDEVLEWIKKECEYVEEHYRKQQ